MGNGMLETRFRGIKMARSSFGKRRTRKIHNKLVVRVFYGLRSRDRKMYNENFGKRLTTQALHCDFRFENVRRLMCFLLLRMNRYIFGPSTEEWDWPLALDSPRFKSSLSLPSFPNAHVYVWTMLFVTRGSGDSSDERKTTCVLKPSCKRSGNGITRNAVSSTRLKIQK